MHPPLRFLRKLEMPLMFLIGLTLGFLLWGKDNLQTALASISPLGEKRFEEIDLTGRPTSGPDDAPITLIEFADYQCPYCQKWHDEVLPRIHQTYRDQVRFVFVDFPLSAIHDQALRAAEAAHCAGDQGQYWPYHDALFAHQGQLSEALYPALATDLGLEADALTACLDADTYADLVEQGAQMAHDLGFTGTPAFVINGQPVVGAQPFEVFQQIIDTELGQ